MKRNKINESILFQLGDYLSSHKLKLVCAESMTAGFLSSTLALEVSSGDYFLGSIVCYDKWMKTHLLDVSPQLIDTYTAESEEVTLAMLQGLTKRIPDASVYVSITGLAFDNGISPHNKSNKEEGRVYYAFEYKGIQHVMQRKFEGNAAQIIIATCNSIFFDLHNWLNTFNDKN